MKNPDEIKKALECCFYDSEQCGECPYYPVSCDRELVRDAREYIRQLEAERDAAVKDLKTAKRCKLCKHDHIKDMDEPCFSCSCCCGVNNFEWRGVQKEE